MHGFAGIMKAIVGAVCLAGCSQRQPDAPPPRDDRTGAHTHLNHALPRLPTVKLWLGSQELTAEVARTEVEVRTGMMFRTNMVEGEGMLFVFPRPLRASFYMRNTTIPLSCAYLDPEGVILETHHLKPHDETPVEAQSSNVQFVLETPLGWFERNQIGPGTVVRTPYGALREFNWASLRPPTRR